MYRRRLADSASATRITWWTIIQEMHPSLFDAQFLFFVICNSFLFWFSFCLIGNLFDSSFKFFTEFDCQPLDGPFSLGIDKQTDGEK